MTEHGSIASENSHLAGSSSVASEQVVQEFCIKERDVDDDVVNDVTDDNDSNDAEEKELYFMEGKELHHFSYSSRTFGIIMLVFIKLSVVHYILQRRSLHTSGLEQSANRPQNAGIVIQPF